MMTSMDFLDNRDLANALADAQAKTGKRLSVLGMDACLMSMVEVAYQVREYADYLVGSQEVELADGWPYEKILGKLAGKPDMTGLDLSRTIVEKFGENYGGMYRGGNISTHCGKQLQCSRHVALFSGARVFAVL